MNIFGPLAGWLILFYAGTAAAKICDPATYGGTPDDRLADTQAIQSAIDDCKDQSGTVILSKGQWETGPLEFGSDMTFRLEAGTILALISDIDLYPPNSADGLRRRAFFAEGVRNLTIEGPGRIDGRGESFWDENFYETGLHRPTLPRPMPVLEILDSQNVTLRNMTLQNLPGFGVAFKRTVDSVADAVTIRNDMRSPNTDGIQISNSRNIRITGANIETGDDAIVLKSNSKPVDRIVVENSRLVSDDGAIKFGTGSRVGVTNSVFRNIDIEESRYGIAIFMIDGGHHRNNLFEDIRIETGGRHNRTYPIFVDVDRREADRDWGAITGLTFRDLDIRTRGASLIAGNRLGRIRELTLERVRVSRSHTSPEALASAKKPRGNINIETQDGSVDYSALQAELVIAHADGVFLDAVSLPSCDDRNERAGLTLIDVSGDIATIEQAGDCPVKP